MNDKASAGSPNEVMTKGDATLMAEARKYIEV